MREAVMECINDPLAAARGIANGLFLSLFLWALPALLMRPIDLTF